MVAVPFPTSSGPGAIPGEGSGRLVNVFAAKDGAVVRWYVRLRRGVLSNVWVTV